MNWAVLDWGILGPALVAGLVVLCTHVPLGARVLERGIVFIDLAIAQMAGLGAMAAVTAGWAEGGLVVQASATVAALLGSAFLTWTERMVPDHQEALIGVSFVLAACAAMLLLAGNPHAGENLKDLLVGQILWVHFSQLLFPALLSALILLVLWRGWVQRWGRFGFYGLFALAVTQSVQLVGIYLVFASLIIPALAVRISAAGPSGPIAMSIGVAGYVLGLLLASLLDWPPGAVIVWSLAACGLLHVVWCAATPRFRDGHSARAA